jgi:DNA-binding XRE family transcriptional regulator
MRGTVFYRHHFRRWKVADRPDKSGSRKIGEASGLSGIVSGSLHQQPPDETGDRKGLFPVPTSPVVMAALRAIYAGGSGSGWDPDSFGRPRFRYESRDGHISFYLRPPPDFWGRFDPSKAIYYVPRLIFTHTGGQRATVRQLSVETADVFLILMARIAKLRDPARDTARITLREIADARGIRVRHGSTHTLYDVFKEEVLRLSDLCMTMAWRDYLTGGTVAFGRERPDRLLDIVDVEYKKGKEAWVAFRFRCGQALSHFLSPEGLRWIGHYSRELLKLSPYHEGFTKKLGTYWTMVGIVAGKKGQMPRATPRTILEFCGEEANFRNPGQTVDAFSKAHERLASIGVLEDFKIPEPVSRTRGYFPEWLESPISARLSEKLWRIAEVRKLTYRQRKSRQKMKKGSNAGSVIYPRRPEDLVRDPSLIRKFRSEFYIRQEELARALGVTRQTLSSYERGLTALTNEKAEKILSLWKRRAGK